MRARIRSIKPELLSDERLWDLGQEHPDLPLLQGFQGLWMFADREGRFEWRSRALGALICPFWRGDFLQVLEALAGAGFIQKYQVGGREYGRVVNFKKHQTPNNKEPASELPSPDLEENSTPLFVDSHASLTREVRVPIQKESSGKGTEGNGRGVTREPRVEHPPGEPPDPPKPPSAALGGPLEFEVFESFREVHGRLNITPPKLSQNQRADAVEHCRDVAKTHGKSLREAALAVAEAAQPGSKSWPFEVARIDPFATAFSTRRDDLAGLRPVDPNGR